MFMGETTVQACFCLCVCLNEVGKVDSMVESVYLKNFERECEKEKAESKKIRAEARKTQGEEQAELLKKAASMPNCEKLKAFYSRS